ncbi:MAG: methionyl-tRNA formyltransferase [Endomicrobium sp.]|nr:methionyl-tRNA formyltransferase [Endomicrobium sp.]
MKILFFGTASISKVYLEHLHKSGHDIFCVTMPDKPASRGQKLTAPAVKTFASENNIPFIQPEKFTPETIERIQNFGADAGIAVSYGRLIPRSVFLLPRYKTFNIHFSLLPKYRGAAPVQYALLNGETETGVSAFYLEETLDTGAIIAQEKMPIDIKDTAETLFDKLVPLGIGVMNAALSRFGSGELNAVPQQGEPSYAPALKKEDGQIDWRKSAGDIYNRFRGFYPWPGVYSVISKGKSEGKRIKFIEMEAVENNTVNDEPGKVFKIEKHKGFTVTCSAGKILVSKVQPENKPVMSAWDFIQGGQISEGDCFCGHPRNSQTGIRVSL